MANKTFTERELMLKAIEVMNKSINEPRPDGKVPPKVGAVLVFPDGSIETAYRGELREGDHAEFTLLERKLQHEKLEDCVLYTTLEPCVKRNAPKVPCCRRTTNARIKKVFVGIEDPDPTVDGKGIKHLEKYRAVVKMFDKDLQKQIRDENQEFIKQAIERKRKHEKEDDNLKSPIEAAVANYNIDKLSTKALQKFIDEAKLDYKVNDNSFLEYLSNFGALEFSNSKNQYIPTGYGVLLFGKDPRVKYKNAVLKAQVTYGPNNIESIDFSDALVLIPDQVEEWLKKVLPLSKDTSSFKRKDVPNFPIEALREAIVNAIVHRDYEVKGAKCEIKIFNDKIIITSPGQPLPAITLDDLNSFEAPSLSRNPIITYVFNLMEYVEEKGFGMNTFKLLPSQYDLPKPSFTFKDPFLTLTFPRNLEAVKSLIGNDAMQNLSEKELGYLELFRQNNTITKSEFVEHTKLATRSAERLLKKWTDNKLLIREGSGPGTYYRINE